MRQFYLTVDIPDLVIVVSVKMDAIKAQLSSKVITVIVDTSQGGKITT